MSSDYEIFAKDGQRRLNPQIVERAWQATGLTLKHFDLANSYIDSSIFVDGRYNGSMDKIDSKLQRISCRPRASGGQPDLSLDGLDLPSCSVAISSDPGFQLSAQIQGMRLLSKMRTRRPNQRGGVLENPTIPTPDKVPIVIYYARFLINSHFTYS
jgi:hypothetical protein